MESLGNYSASTSVSILHRTSTIESEHMSSVFVNGQFVEKEDATVSVFDVGLLFGDGVFEGIRIYNSHPFRIDEHLKRLFESAKAIRLDMPWASDELAGLVRETSKRNAIVDGYVRLVVTRGAHNNTEVMPGISNTSNLCVEMPTPTLIIIADQISLYPQDRYENGLTLRTVGTRRMHKNSLNPRIKSLNYLNNVQAKCEAKDVGADEALMLDTEGNVCESTADNIFAVLEPTLVVTPPPHLSILAGITRDIVIGILRDMKIQVIQRAFVKAELAAAEECFLTGTAAEVVPVREVDGQRFDTVPGPVTKAVMNQYKRLVAYESGSS